MSTSDRFPLAAKKIYKGKVGDIASPFLSGTRLAFEWNKGALTPLVERFQQIDPEEPRAEALKELPPEHEKQPTKDNEPLDGTPTHVRGDMLACYRPASLHHDKPRQYGIWFFAGKVHWQAQRIADRLREAGHPVLEDEVLEALIVKIFWHEVGHAWIEDIASAIEPSLKTYKSIHERYGGYIFDEEAFCNTLALRTLRLYLRKRKDTPLIAAMIDFMRKQGRGYRNFQPLKPWEKGNHEELEKEIENLLVDVYGFKERTKVSDAIRKFFHVENKRAHWVTHDAFQAGQKVPPFMLNWKHPLHAEGISKGESEGQSLPKLLEPFLKIASAATVPSSELVGMVMRDPGSFSMCDFIGPHAPLRIQDALKHLELPLLESLEAAAPSSIDYYGNSILGKELYKRRRDAVIGKIAAKEQVLDI